VVWMKDVVVVLGCRPERGRPTDELVRRVKHALRFCSTLDEPFILFSGGRTSGKYSEALLMQRIAEGETTFELPSLLENRSLDTIGNAFFSSLILRQLRYGSLTIVTSPYHVPRSRMLFSHMIGGDVATSTFGPVPSELPPSERHGFELAEYMLDGVPEGDLDALRRKLFSDHPLYAQRYRR